MTVKELIKELLKCPQEMDVEIYYDGTPCYIPNFAYQGKSFNGDKDVVVLGQEDNIYNLEGHEKIYFNFNENRND